MLICGAHWRTAGARMPTPWAPEDSSTAGGLLGTCQPSDCLLGLLPFARIGTPDPARPPAAKREAPAVDLRLGPEDRRTTGDPWDHRAPG